MAHTHPNWKPDLVQENNPDVSFFEYLLNDDIHQSDYAREVEGYLTRYYGLTRVERQELPNFQTAFYLHFSDGEVLKFTMDFMKNYPNRRWQKQVLEEVIAHRHLPFDELPQEKFNRAMKLMNEYLR